MIRKSILFLSQKIGGSKWYVFFGLLLFGLLDLSYRYFLVPAIGSGYRLNIDMLKYAESWIIYVVLVVLFPKKLEKASDILMNFLLFQYLAPLLVFYGLSNASRGHLYIVLLGVALILAFRMGNPIRLPMIRGARAITVAILLIGTLGVTGWLFLSGGFAYFNLDFSRVYEFRRDVGAVISQGPMGYVNVWAFKVFGPFLLSLALWKKNYAIAGVVVFLHIIWFGISSHKAVFFYPLLIVFVWIYFRYSKALIFIPIGIAFVVLISFTAYFLFDDITPGSLFIRRSMFVPPSLTFAYYDFFSLYKFVYWSNSMTSAFIDYPYHLPYTLMIGAHTGNPDASANNSFLATGYMHAGIPGVIFYGIAVGLIFRLIDSLSFRGVPLWVAISSILVPSRSLLISADLPTALLTHGIGIAIVLLFFSRELEASRGVYSHSGTKPFMATKFPEKKRIT